MLYKKRLLDIKSIIQRLREITRIPEGLKNNVIDEEKEEMLLNIIGAVTDGNGTRAWIMPYETLWLKDYFPEDHPIWSYVRELGT